MRDHAAVEAPNWDTKQHCSCGYRSVSKCEMWKHWADEREAEVARLRSDNDALNETWLRENAARISAQRDLDRALDALRGMVNIYGWFTTPEPEPLREARAVLAAHDREANNET